MMAYFETEKFSGLYDNITDGNTAVTQLRQIAYSMSSSPAFKHTSTFDSMPFGTPAFSTTLDACATARSEVLSALWSSGIAYKDMIKDLEDDKRDLHSVQESADTLAKAVQLSSSSKSEPVIQSL